MEKVAGQMPGGGRQEDSEQGLGEGQRMSLNTTF